MISLSSINVGSGPNDGTGDTIRYAFLKSNTNFEIIDSLNTVVSSSSADWNDATSDSLSAENVYVSGNIVAENCITAGAGLSSTEIFLNHPNSNSTPSTSSSTGASGEVRWDADYLYICIATDTWKRSGLNTW